MGRRASVIIPFGGGRGYIDRLSNCLRSVRWQRHVDHEKVEIVLVYLRSLSSSNRDEDLKQLYSITQGKNVLIIETEKEYKHFPLCLARNIGARVAKNETLVFIDADTVLDPEFLARSLRQREKLVTCWFSYLEKDHRGITGAGCVRPMVLDGKVMKAAYGGGIVAPKKAVEGIRGFDEVYDSAWGADDNDIVDRLIGYGLEWYNLTTMENVVNLHQYHPSFIDQEAPGTIANRKRYYNLQTIVRNEKGWGER